jgi:hypothetical protein
LNDKYRIEFFVTPADFDVLFRWSEKAIPLKIIKESIDQVVKRWQKKKKKIYSFLNFTYEVKKRAAFSIDLELGKHLREKTEGEPEVRDNPDEFQNFLNKLTPTLSGLRSEIELIDTKNKKKALTDADIEEFNTKLLIHFKDDREMQLKAERFMKNLPDQFRNEEMKRKWEINYLLNRFKIPLIESS